MAGRKENHMIYAEKVKKELDTILEAFADYIENQNYFDIVYSKKIGYVWIVIDPPGSAGVEWLNTPEAMLDVLFNDVINGVISSSEENVCASDTRTLTEHIEAESRQRIAAILERISDGGSEYLDYLDRYIQAYQERYCDDTFQ